MLPRAGVDPSEALTAPQAMLMSLVADGVFNRNLPWAMIFTGGGMDGSRDHCVRQVVGGA